MYKIGTTHNRMSYGIESLEGPHLTKEGKPFEPVLMESLTMAEAMNTRFDDDRHFTCYSIEGLDEWPRIKKVFKDLPVLLKYIAFDWDTPNHEELTEETFSLFIDAFYALTDPSLSQWKYVYTSRKGARIIYELPGALHAADAEKYIAAMFLKFQQAGLKVDEQCKDWTRMFRCPQVLRDGQRTEEAPFYFFDEREEVLDISAIEPVSARVVPTLRNFDTSRHGQPAHDEVADVNKEEAAKEIRKEIKKYPQHASLLMESVPLAEKGSRNDAIMKTVGSVIPIVLRKVPYAEPKHLYAFLYNKILIMDRDQDWFGHVWNAILTIWKTEVDRLNIEKKAEATKQAEALSAIEKVAAGMSKWCSHPDLLNPLEREEFVKRHCIASLHKLFFLMDKDGSYGPFPVSKEQLVSRIRTTYLNDIIPTREFGAQGRMVDASAQAIQNNFSTPINEALLVPQLESDGYIEDMDGRNPVLKLPMYRRNPHLVPEYNEDVDTWLVLLFGRHYEQAINWIANALAFEEGPICALSITAPRGVGKKLLAEGLAECLEKPLVASGKDAVSRFNGALAMTPFLNVNEEWPKGAMSNQELFKCLTAGDKLPIEMKFKPGMHITNPVRILLTANNHDMVRSLLDKDLTLADREAIGQRLLHFDLTGEAAQWLEENGGNAFTGRKGKRWIAGVTEPSNYLVAKHFLWLWSQREVPEFGFTGRYLVDGNCDKDSSFIAKQIAQKDTTATVIDAILNIVELKGAKRYVLEEKTFAVYVTINNILDELKLNENPMTFGQVNRILRNITKSQEPVVMNYLEYHEINCEYLLSFASSTGRDTPELRKIVFKQNELTGK